MKIISLYAAFYISGVQVKIAFKRRKFRESLTITHQPLGCQKSHIDSYLGVLTKQFLGTIRMGYLFLFFWQSEVNNNKLL